MTSKADILDAMQYASISSKDAINTTGSPREVITYKFAGTSEPSGFVGKTQSGWTVFTAAEKTAIKAAMAHIETFLNVDFVKVSGGADPDLDIGNVSLPGSVAGTGGFSISSSGSTIVNWDAYVIFDNTLDLSLDTHTDLLLHELGHALGLKHPFKAPVLPTGEDNNKYTVMSYTSNPDNGQDSDAMMLYDVYALQDTWGRASYLTGATTYTGSRTNTVDTVWDSGGTDTFDASAKSSDVTLDLRQGSFSQFGSYDDVVIAYGTKIENATGGAGADVITGNTLANALKGNAGADSLSGGGKGDTLRGGAGKDSLYGQNGNDTLRGDNGNDKIFGGAGKDVLKGNNGRDILKGGKGDDTLQGGEGNDRLWGNSGADRFLFSKGHANDTIKDFANNVDEIQFSGLGSKSSILSKASTINGDVVFDFGDGDTLTVLNITKAQITDDILT